MRETVLFVTKDNRPVVTNIEYNSPAEKSQKVFQCKNYFDNHGYTDFFNTYNGFVRAGAPTSDPNYEIFTQLDSNNTEFLQHEIKGYGYMKRRAEYRNDVQNNNTPAGMTPLLPGLDFSLSEDDIPEEIKNLGFKITPKDDEYNIKLNRSTGKYEIENFSTWRAWVNVDNLSVKVVRNHFKMDAATKQKMDTMVADFLRKHQANPRLTASAYARRITDTADRSLFEIYADEYKYAGKRKYFLAHEFKHIKNKMFTHALYLDRGTKRPTVEDMYRLSVEDERSAYLSQVINSVNKYLIKGNYDDFTMFDGESRWLADKLRALPTAQRRDMATDLPTIVAGELEFFESSHRKKYDDEQFAGNVANYVDEAPLSVEEDTARELFLRIRKQYYKFAVYNPDTGRMEQKSLGDYIDAAHEVNVKPDTLTNIINPAKQRLQRRLDDYNTKLRGGNINPALVEPAKKMMRDTAHQPRFIGTDNLDIDCLDRNLTPQTPRPHHTNPNWSDNLRRYWSTQEGYQEIARTADEYTFKIKNDEITYTDKSSVSVSADSEYDTYIKLLKEPSNQNSEVNFLPTLEPEQALKLYVACVAQGRRMTGKVPTDLRGLANLQGIPAADLQKAQRTASGRPSASPTPAPSRGGRGGHSDGR